MNTTILQKLQFDMFPFQSNGQSDTLLLISEVPLVYWGSGCCALHNIPLDVASVSVDVYFNWTSVWVRFSHQKHAYN